MDNRAFCELCRTARSHIQEAFCGRALSPEESEQIVQFVTATGERFSRFKLFFARFEDPGSKAIQKDPIRLDFRILDIAEGGRVHGSWERFINLYLYRWEQFAQHELLNSKAPASDLVPAK